MKKQKQNDGAHGVTRPTTESAAAAVRALQAGPWAEYLAGEPEKARQFRVLVEQITAAVAQFRPEAKTATERMVNLAEHGRQIGIAVVEMEEMFAGKKLTEDFWRQVEPLFADSTGQKITRDMLLWFAKIARRHPDPITSIDEARQEWQPMLLASGEPEFQLQGERPAQVLHAPPNPLSLLKEQFNFTRLEDIWKQLRSDGNYCPGGRMRSDLRETLRVELEPAFKIVEELKKEIGL